MAFLIKNILIFLIVHHSISVLGQAHFINYTSQDGLPSENVLCAAEDQNGFMWFGTSAGICQFDGINFIDFSSKGKGDFPGGVYVSAIEIDNKNNIWVGTEKQGIYYYDRLQNSWTHFSQHKQGFLQLKSNEIFCLYVTDNGLMWYGSSNGGLGCIDLIHETNENYNMHHLPKRNTWLNRVYDIVPVHNNNSELYVIGQGYVYVFDQHTRKYEVPNFQNEPVVEGDFVFSPQSIVNSREDEVWLGSWDSGVKSFNFSTGTFENVYPSETLSSVNWRSDVHKGAEGELWITHRQEGIVRYRLKTGDFEFIKSEPYNRNGLLKGDYNAVFQSSNNYSWVLTSQGISLLIPQYQAFSYYQTEVEKTNFFLDIDIIPDSKSFIASFAGENAPLKILNNDLAVIEKVYFRKPKNTFQSIYETEIYRDKILCRSAELLEYRPTHNKLNKYSIPLVNPKGVIQDLLVHEEDLWLLYGDGSLVKFNEVTGELNEYPFDGYDNADSDQIIYHGLASMGNQLWAATHAEVVHFNMEKEKLQYFYLEDNEIHQREKTSPIHYSGTLIEQIIPVNKRSAWILTSGNGLYLVEKTPSDQLSVIDHRDKTILSQLQTPMEMISGTDNDYWLATRNGLVHTDSTLSTFIVYGQNEGLHHTKLSQGLERIDNELFIGMPKGFVRVDIPHLLSGQQNAHVSISQVLVNGKEINKHIPPQLKYSENNIVIHVAAPIYHESRSVIYYTRCVGQMDDWQESGAYDQIYRYQNLKPGRYQFEVKARTPGTTWSNIQTFSFDIKPPFWGTWWFKVLIIAFFAAIGYAIYRFKLKKDLKEERIKTKLASLESQALRAQMNPHFIFNSLNSIKSLILLDRKEEGVTYLTKFSKLVREILKVSKERYIPLHQELELLTIYLDMESLRFHQKFDYTINIDPSINIYRQKVPPLLIQPYVENSIWHGLLHLEGDAHLDISLYEKNDFLYVIIEDNGIGRQASQMVKAKDSIYNKRSQGLKLSKNRIDLVSEFAEVNIQDLKENDIASGTRVTIKLPSNDGKKV